MLQFIDSSKQVRMSRSVPLNMHLFTSVKATLALSFHLLAD